MMSLACEWWIRMRNAKNVACDVIDIIVIVVIAMRDVGQWAKIGKTLPNFFIKQMSKTK